jgi:hypothetical protein
MARLASKGLWIEPRCCARLPQERQTTDLLTVEQRATGSAHMTHRHYGLPVAEPRPTYSGPTRAAAWSGGAIVGAIIAAPGLTCQRLRRTAGCPRQTQRRGRGSHQNPLTAPSRSRMGSRSPCCASSMMRLATSCVAGSVRSTSLSSRTASSKAFLFYSLYWHGRILPTYKP